MGFYDRDCGGRDLLQVFDVLPLDQRICQPLQLLHHLVSLSQSQTRDHDVHVRRLEGQARHERAEHLDPWLLGLEHFIGDLLQLFEDEPALRVKSGDVLGDCTGIGFYVGVELLVEGVFDFLVKRVSLLSGRWVEFRPNLQPNGGSLHCAWVGSVDPVNELLEQNVVVELEALVVHEGCSDIVRLVAVLAFRAQNLSPLIAVVRKLRVLAAKLEDLGPHHLIWGLSSERVERLGIQPDCR